MTSIQNPEHNRSMRQKLGQARGKIESANKTPEDEAIDQNHDPAYQHGLKESYDEDYDEVFDAITPAAAQILRTCDDKDMPAAARMYLRLSDSEYEAKKESNNKWSILKDGTPTYTVTKDAKGNYSCTCTAFKFKHTCKHVDMVKQLDKAPAKKSLYEGNSDLPDPHARHPRAEFEKFMPELEEICKPFDKWEPVGSWRREKPDFKDVDVIALASPEAWNQVHQSLQNSGEWKEFTFGDTLMRGVFHGYYLDFNLCPDPNDWLWWLIYRTGSADENVALRKRAIQMGYSVSEKGVKDRFTDENVPIQSEEEFYNFLGYEYNPPKLRDAEHLRPLKGWNLEDHISEGKRSVEQDTYDMEDYISTMVDKLKDKTTVYRSAKYHNRLVILVCKELARRLGKTPEELLATQTPEPAKRGQQTWDSEGNVYTQK